MKKILLIFLLTITYTNSFAQKSTIKSDADSLSYAYGVGLAQQGLQQYLQQLGVIADPTPIKTMFADKIASETNDVEKQKLEKQLQTKLDSIAKADKISVAKFIEGMTTRFNSKDENSSYFEGLALGSQILKMIDPFTEQLYGKNTQEKINKDLVLLGISNVLREEPIQIENAHSLIEQKMRDAQEKTDAEQDAELRIQYEADIKKGENFLSENKSRPNVVALPSGLQYQILTEGAGPKPTTSDRVKVHYRGTLMNGTEFDSSIARGEPSVFGVGQVIKGWTEALQLMPVGSKWMLFIPSDLAYGSRGAGGQIPPFATLIFEVELLGIE